MPGSIRVFRHDLQLEFLQPAQLGEKLTRLAPGESVFWLCNSWPDEGFIGFVIQLDGEQCSRIRLLAFDKHHDDPCLDAKITLFPQLATRVVIPLRCLDGETVFLPRTPGRLKATIIARRTRPEDVDRWSLTIDQAPDLNGADVSKPTWHPDLPHCPVPKVVLIDELGQNARRQWPGRCDGLEDLCARLRAELAAEEPAPVPTYGPHGGWPETTFAASGRFRCHHDGERWWLVDPAGQAFFSAGIDGVRPDAPHSVLPGTESLHAWLPERDDPAFADCWSQGRDLGFDMVHANLRRCFGDDWPGRWRELSRRRMIAAGFNTIGNWSDPTFCKQAGLPWVLPMKAFPRTPLMLFRDLPDVFDPAFEQAAGEWAEQLREHSDDQGLVGYFMNNEPQFAFGRFNLAAEMLEDEPNSHSRSAFVAWLQERYDGIEALNAAWQGAPDIERWSDLETRCFHRLAETSERADSDCWAFTGRIIERYTAIPAAACRQVLPEHLNLGLRWAWIADDALYAGAEHVDVFSINLYQMTPSPDHIAEISRKAGGKPVLIGEWHHGAPDKGLPSGALRTVATHAERGRAYAAYLEAAARIPELVGCHYFIWNDQPLLGRFDGENFSIGFIDVAQQPHAELMQAARAVHERLYAIRSGADHIITSCPPEYASIGA